jgi:4'-phosphopantetheinyl transferase EntD
LIKKVKAYNIQSFFTSDNKALSLDKLGLPQNHNYSPKRLTDFSRGRYCAIKALEQIGVENAIIPIGEDRAPIWPEGIVGSISHCDSMVGSIVALKENYNSIGLDIEEIGKVGEDLWDLLFTAKEIAFLNRLSLDDSVLFSTVLFSMKEAFYKMQFPLTKTFLDFKDVEIEVNNSCFYLRILTEFHPKNKLPILNEIFYLVEKNVIITYAFNSITS